MKYERELANANSLILEGCDKRGIRLPDLREISLELSPNDLRRVARFFEHYAREIESGGWRGGHVHIESFDSAWRDDHPEADVIILNPDPDPPAMVDY